MKPSAERRAASAGSAATSRSQVLRPAERGVVEPVERRVRGEQRLERRGLAVVERDPDRGDAVVVRRGELRLARHSRLDAAASPALTAAMRSHRGA